MLPKGTQENVQHVSNMRFEKRMVNIRLTHGRRINLSNICLTYVHECTFYIGQVTYVKQVFWKTYVYQSHFEKN